MTTPPSGQDVGPVSSRSLRLRHCGIRSYSQRTPLPQRQEGAHLNMAHPAKLLQDPQIRQRRTVKGVYGPATPLSCRQTAPASRAAYTPAPPLRLSHPMSALTDEKAEMRWFSLSRRPSLNSPLSSSRQSSHAQRGATTPVHAQSTASASSARTSADHGRGGGSTTASNPLVCRALPTVARSERGTMSRVSSDDIQPQKSVKCLFHRRNHDALPPSPPMLPTMAVTSGSVTDTVSTPIHESPGVGSFTPTPGYTSSATTNTVSSNGLIFTTTTRDSSSCGDAASSSHEYGLPHVLLASAAARGFSISEAGSPLVNTGPRMTTSPLARGHARVPSDATTTPSFTSSAPSRQSSNTPRRTTLLDAADALHVPRQSLILLAQTQSVSSTSSSPRKHAELLGTGSTSSAIVSLSAGNTLSSSPTWGVLNHTAGLSGANDGMFLSSPLSTPPSARTTPTALLSEDISVVAHSTAKCAAASAPDSDAPSHNAGKSSGGSGSTHPVISAAQPLMSDVTRALQLSAVGAENVDAREDEPVVLRCTASPGSDGTDIDEYHSDRCAGVPPDNENGRQVKHVARCRRWLDSPQDDDQARVFLAEPLSIVRGTSANSPSALSGTRTRPSSSNNTTRATTPTTAGALLFTEKVAAQTLMPPAPRDGLCSPRHIAPSAVPLNSEDSDARGSVPAGGEDGLLLLLKSPMPPSSSDHITWHAHTQQLRLSTSEEFRESSVMAMNGGNGSSMMTSFLGEAPPHAVNTTATPPAVLPLAFTSSTTVLSTEWMNSSRRVSTHRTVTGSGSMSPSHGSSDGPLRMRISTTSSSGGSHARVTDRAAVSGRSGRTPRPFSVTAPVSVPENSATTETSTTSTSDYSGGSVTSVSAPAHVVAPLRRHSATAPGAHARAAAATETSMSTTADAVSGDGGAFGAHSGGHAEELVIATGAALPAVFVAPSSPLELSSATDDAWGPAGAVGDSDAAQVQSPSRPLAAAVTATRRDHTAATAPVSMARVAAVDTSLTSTSVPSSPPIPHTRDMLNARSTPVMASACVSMTVESIMVDSALTVSSTAAAPVAATSLGDVTSGENSLRGGGGALIDAAGLSVKPGFSPNHLSNSTHLTSGADSLSHCGSGGVTGWSTRQGRRTSVTVLSPSPAPDESHTANTSGASHSHTLTITSVSGPSGVMAPGSACAMKRNSRVSVPPLTSTMTTAPTRSTGPTVAGQAVSEEHATPTVSHTTKPAMTAANSLADDPREDFTSTALSLAFFPERTKTAAATHSARRAHPMRSEKNTDSDCARSSQSQTVQPDLTRSAATDAVSLSRTSTSVRSHTLEGDPLLGTLHSVEYYMRHVQILDTPYASLVETATSAVAPSGTATMPSPLSWSSGSVGQQGRRARPAPMIDHALMAEAQQKISDWNLNSNGSVAGISPTTTATSGLQSRRETFWGSALVKVDWDVSRRGSKEAEKNMSGTGEEGDDAANPHASDAIGAAHTPSSATRREDLTGSRAPQDEDSEGGTGTDDVLSLNGPMLGTPSLTTRTSSTSFAGATAAVDGLARLRQTLLSLGPTPPSAGSRGSSEGDSSALVGFPVSTTHLSSNSASTVLAAPLYWSRLAASAGPCGVGSSVGGQTSEMAATGTTALATKAKKEEAEGDADTHAADHAAVNAMFSTQDSCQVERDGTQADIDAYTQAAAETDMTCDPAELDVDERWGWFINTRPMLEAAARQQQALQEEHGNKVPIPLACAESNEASASSVGAVTTGTTPAASMCHQTTTTTSSAHEESPHIGIATAVGTMANPKITAALSLHLLSIPSDASISPATVLRPSLAATLECIGVAGATSWYPASVMDASITPSQFSAVLPPMDGAGETDSTCVANGHGSSSSSGGGALVSLPRPNPSVPASQSASHLELSTATMSSVFESANGMGAIPTGGSARSGHGRAPRRRAANVDDSIALSDAGRADSVLSLHATTSQTSVRRGSGGQVNVSGGGVGGGAGGGSRGGRRPQGRGFNHRLIQAGATSATSTRSTEAVAVGFVRGDRGEDGEHLTSASASTTFPFTPTHCKGFGQHIRTQRAHDDVDGHRGAIEESQDRHKDDEGDDDDELLAEENGSCCSALKPHARSAHGKAVTTLTRAEASGGYSDCQRSKVYVPLQNVWNGVGDYVSSVTMTSIAAAESSHSTLFSASPTPRGVPSDAVDGSEEAGQVLAKRLHSRLSPVDNGDGGVHRATVEIVRATEAACGGPSAHSRERWGSDVSGGTQTPRWLRRVQRDSVDSAVASTASTPPASAGFDVTARRVLNVSTVSSNLPTAQDISSGRHSSFRTSSSVSGTALAMSRRGARRDAGESMSSLPLVWRTPFQRSILDAIHNSHALSALLRGVFGNAYKLHLRSHEDDTTSSEAPTPNGPNENNDSGDSAYTREEGSRDVVVTHRSAVPAMPRALTHVTQRLTAQPDEDDIARAKDGDVIGYVFTLAAVHSPHDQSFSIDAEDDEEDGADNSDEDHNDGSSDEDSEKEEAHAHAQNTERAMRQVTSTTAPGSPTRSPLTSTYTEQSHDGGGDAGLIGSPAAPRRERLTPPTSTPFLAPRLINSVEAHEKSSPVSLELLLCPSSKPHTATPRYMATTCQERPPTGDADAHKELGYGTPHTENTADKEARAASSQAPGGPTGVPIPPTTGHSRSSIASRALHTRVSHTPYQTYLPLGLPTQTVGESAHMDQPPSSFGRRKPRTAPDEESAGRAAILAMTLSSPSRLVETPIPDKASDSHAAPPAAPAAYRAARTGVQSSKNDRMDVSPPENMDSRSRSFGLHFHHAQPTASSPTGSADVVATRRTVSGAPLVPLSTLAWEEPTSFPSSPRLQEGSMRAETWVTSSEDGARGRAGSRQTIRLDGSIFGVRLGDTPAEATLNSFSWTDDSSDE